MAIAERVRSYLDARRVPFEILAHPCSYSARDTSAAAHVAPDHIAKAVVLADGQGPVMVVVPGSQWVRLGAVCQELGRELELASEAEVGRWLPDCEPGAVPPLGEAYGIECLLDEALASLATIYFELGDHELLARASGEDFLRLMQGSRRGNFSHPS